MGRKHRLTPPHGYRVVREMVDPGTGMGDDRSALVLQHWETWTAGRLWWRKTRTGWRTIETARPGMTEASLVQTAWARAWVPKS